MSLLNRHPPRHRVHVSPAQKEWIDLWVGVPIEPPSKGMISNTTGHPIKLLFICSRNRRRSLTAEHIFSGIAGIQVRSAGTQPEARIVVTAGHVGWADLIFLMEKSHLNRLRRKFPEALDGKQTVTLLIPDDYEYMQPALVDELVAKVGRYIDLG